EVTIAGLSLGGADAGNYTLTLPTSAADIVTKTLTIAGLTVSPKIYDATTNATVVGTASLVGVLGGDDVTLVGTPVGTFVSADAGSNTDVTVSGLSLDGADA